MKLRPSVLLVALAVSSCNRTPPDLQAVVDAANALGGREKILAIKTLTIEGEGSAPNVGQNTMPDSDLPVWKVTEFKRVIDPGQGRMRVQQLRTAQFLFANSPIQRQDMGLDRRRGLQRRHGRHGSTGAAQKPRATATSRCCTTRSRSCVPRSISRARR